MVEAPAAVCRNGHEWGPGPAVLAGGRALGDGPRRLFSIVVLIRLPGAGGIGGRFLDGCLLGLGAPVFVV